MRYRNTNLIRGKTVFILTLPRAHINSIRYYIIIGHCISKSIQGWKDQTKDKRCNQRAKKNRFTHREAQDRYIVKIFSNPKEQTRIIEALFFFFFFFSKTQKEI